MNNDYQLLPSFIKRDRIAWVGTHRHSRVKGNEAYTFCYLFAYALDLPPNAKTLTLPNNDRIRIFAVTTGGNFNNEVRAAQFLYDAAKSTSVTISKENGGYFIKAAPVSLKALPENADIRYTLDGSDPGPSSPLYRGPFIVRETVTLKARAFSPDIGDRHLLAYPFTKVVPLPAVDKGALTPGIQYEFYKGDWDTLPDFDKLKPEQKGTIDRFIFPEGAAGDLFGLRYTGFIDIRSEGVYTFYTTSDAGSNLFIGDRLVVDNDGDHRPDEIAGTIALGAGKHPITVTFFEKRGGEALQVQYEGPGIPKQEIGAEVLYSRR